MNADQNKIQTDKLENERNLGLLCHLLAFAGFLFPFGNIIAPLILWLYKKDISDSVNYNGKEVINFQISMTIYSIIAGFLVIIIIGFIGLAILTILNIIFTIKGAIVASNNEKYAYPMSIRMLK